MHPSASQVIDTSFEPHSKIRIHATRAFLPDYLVPAAASDCYCLNPSISTYGCLFHGMQAIIAKQAAAMKAPPRDSVQSRGLLRVTVVEATNLPKLDLLRASDPYCLVFLTDEAGEPGEIVYRTEVVPHNSNPIFNEVRKFVLARASEHDIACAFNACMLALSVCLPLSFPHHHPFSL